MNHPENDKQRLADALKRMTGSASPEPASGADASPPRPSQPAGQKPNPRVRPAFPTIAPQNSQSISNDDQTPPVDDDRVSMAAPTPQDLISTRRAAASRSLQKSESKSIRTRRTIAPILLTLGVMLPILGGLWFVTDEDSPFRSLSVIVPISLILFGLILLVVGVLNVLYLSLALKQNKPLPTRAR